MMNIVSISNQEMGIILQSIEMPVCINKTIVVLIIKINWIYESIIFDLFYLYFTIWQLGYNKLFMLF